MGNFGGFLDEYWLLFTYQETPFCQPAHKTPPLTLLNTERGTTEDKTFAQITFSYQDDCRKIAPDAIDFRFDLGGHEPSREESSLAPFYPDPSQRLLAIELNTSEFSVIKVETLLGLAREHQRTELRWEEWFTHATRLQSQSVRSFWVSSPQVFYAFCKGGKAGVDVYDFGRGTHRRTAPTLGPNVRPQVTSPTMVPAGVEEDQRVASPRITYDLSKLDPRLANVAGGSRGTIATFEVRTTPLKLRGN
jgi:hypothetical protein